MTRRRIIAGVILLAAVAVAVPFVSEIWIWIAYAEKSGNGMVYYEKHLDWLPGVSQIIPSQLCSGCQDPSVLHYRCLGGKHVWNEGPRRWRYCDSHDTVPLFVCTCAHPLHKPKHYAAQRCGAYYPNGLAYQVIWRRTGGMESLHYCVIYSERAGLEFSAFDFPIDLVPDGMTVAPNGVFLNGTLVSTAESRVLFCSADRSITPVEFTEDELFLFARSQIDSLPKTSFWREKIEPLLD